MVVEQPTFHYTQATLQAKPLYSQTCFKVIWSFLLMTVDLYRQVCVLVDNNDHWHSPHCWLLIRQLITIYRFIYILLYTIRTTSNVRVKTACIGPSSNWPPPSPGFVIFHAISFYPCSIHIFHYVHLQKTTAMLHTTSIPSRLPHLLTVLHRSSRVHYT